MKKMLYAFLFIVLFLIVAGYFFVQWANKPENVAETLRQHEIDRQEKVEEEKRQKEETERLEKRRQESLRADEAITNKTEADLQLVVDETFAEKRLNVLQSTSVSANRIKFTEKGLSFEDGIVTPRSNRSHALAITPDEYENFVAEIEVQGNVGYGIVFGYQPTQDHWRGNYAYIDDKRDYIKTYIGKKSDYKSLEKIEKRDFHVFRLEKKAKQIRASLNGKVIFESTIENYPLERGKVGIYVSYVNTRTWNESYYGIFRRFRLWKW